MIDRSIAAAVPYSSFVFAQKLRRLIRAECQGGAIGGYNRPR